MRLGLVTVGLDVPRWHAAELEVRRLRDPSEQDTGPLSNSLSESREREREFKFIQAGELERSHWQDRGPRIGSGFTDSDPPRTELEKGT